MPKGSWREFDQPSSRMSSDFASNNLPKQDCQLRVQKTRIGKGGKTVTVISGLCIEILEVKRLLKILKSHCSTGGTIKGDLIELQGDQVKLALEVLIKNGYSAKKAGG